MAFTPVADDYTNYWNQPKINYEEKQEVYYFYWNYRTDYDLIFSGRQYSL